MVLSAVGAIMDEKGGPMRGMLGGTQEPKPMIESTTRFVDVKGVDEAKAELEEIVAYLKARVGSFICIRCALSHRASPPVGPEALHGVGRQAA